MLSTGFSRIQHKIQRGIDCSSSSDKRAPLSAWTLRVQKSEQIRTLTGERSPMPCHPTAVPSHLTSSQHTPGLQAPSRAWKTRHALNPNCMTHFSSASIRTGKKGICERCWGLRSFLPQQAREDRVGRLNLANF